MTARFSFLFIEPRVVLEMIHQLLLGWLKEVEDPLGLTTNITYQLIGSCN